MSFIVEENEFYCRNSHFKLTNNESSQCKLLLHVGLKKRHLAGSNPTVILGKNALDK